MGTMENLILHIEGMSCGHCLNAVNKAIASLDGVEIGSVKIGRAELRYDPARIHANAIAAAITEVGYRATPAPSPV